MANIRRDTHTHYRSKRRYEDALQVRNHGEVTLNLGNIAGAGGGAMPIGTGEIAGSGSNEFFRVSSADELDTFFRIPVDFDATATSYVTTYYAVASSTTTAADIVRPVYTYQIPVLDTPGEGLGSAASSEGVGSPTAVTLGAGGSTVGAIYEAEGTLSSAFTGVAGGFCHFQVKTGLTGTDDVEIRLYNKAVFRYAKDYLT